MLRWEGEDPIVSEKFYRVVVQAVLIFGLETLMFMAAMLQKLEGVHVVFLRQVMDMNSQRLGGNTWIKEGADRLLQSAGTKPLWEYINKKKATVA